MSSLWQRYATTCCTHETTSQSLWGASKREDTTTVRADTSDAEIALPSPRKRVASPVSIQPKKKQRTGGLEDFVMQTSSKDKSVIDHQLAKMIYATNCPFLLVEHNEFIKLMSMLRPGYKPPTRYDISGRLLDEVHISMLADCKDPLGGETVSMALDGWSNVHNEPVVCVSVTSEKGQSFITGTMDSSGYSHTSKYLQEIASEAVRFTEEQFACRIGSFVTDNAANMLKMRKNLADDSESDMVSYGCSAHYMNLLAKDVEVSGVKEHVVHIIKFFRNGHLPAAWYQAADGKMLVLPLDVRWNTLSDCLRSYLDNWSILLKVCAEHRDDIDKSIAAKVTDFGLKRNAEDYLQRMRPIAVALDTIQSDSCKISDTVAVWKKLEEDLKESHQPTVIKKLLSRTKQAPTPAHFLANILDPKHQGKHLTDDEIDTAMEYCSEHHPTCLASVVNMRTQTGPFKPYMFKEETVTMVAIAGKSTK